MARSYFPHAFFVLRQPCSNLRRLNKVDQRSVITVVPAERDVRFFGRPVMILAVADQVNDAGLQPRGRKHRLQSLGQALQA